MWNPNVNHKIQQMTTMSTGGLVDFQALRVRPVYDKELGEFFAKFRTDRKWSQRLAAIRAADKNLRLTRQVLMRWPFTPIRSR